MLNSVVDMCRDNDGEETVQELVLDKATEQSPVTDKAY